MKQLAGTRTTRPSALHAGWRRPSHPEKVVHRQRATSTRAVKAADSLQSLIAWAEANKIATDKLATSVSIATDAPLLVAARDIPAGEAILSVPDAHWLSPAAAAKSPIGAKVSSLEPWLQLALLLVAERAGRGGAAPAAYVSSLPAAPAMPLFWSDGEIDMLRGTQLLQQVYGYRQFFQQTFKELEAGLFAADRSLFPSDVFTYDAFVWAVATVRSRAHAPLDGAGIALVPLADQLPHRRGRGANCVWRTKSAGLFGKGQALVVEAARAVRKGEELAMDYGPGKLDAAVLLDYGVMDAAWPQGGYTLTLSVPETDRYRDDKLDILERAGLGGTASFAVKKGDEPSDEMMGFLRLTQLSGSDCFLLEPIFEADVWSFMCAPVSPANEEAVCSSVAAGVRAALAGYGGGIEDDLALLKGGSLAPGSAAEMAVQVRLGEKEALDSFLGWLESRQANLKGLEYYQERRLKRLGLMDEEGRTTYDSFFKDGIA